MIQRALATIALLALAASANAARGFNDGYTVYYGDLNGDNLRDLYVRPLKKFVPVALDDLSVPILVSGDVPDFVLLNTGSRTFTIAPALTPAQLATVRQWPAAPALDLSFRDVDQNGTIDMEIDGLASYVQNAFDQIVYSRTVSNQLPTNLTAKNIKYQRFHEQVFGWIRDNEYFEKNAPWKIVSVEPGQRAWYASVNDSTNVSLMNMWVMQCRSQYPAYTCALSTAPPPGPCVRPVIVYDDAGNYLGPSTEDICSKPIQIIIYLPGSIVVEKDYSNYDEDARETVDIIIRLRNNCPYFDNTDEQILANGMSTVMQNFFAATRRVANVMNSESHAPFPGDSLFPEYDKTFHHYDVRTKICSMNRPNCTLPVVRDIVHRSFSMPHLRLAPLFTPVPSTTPLMAHVAPPGLSGIAYAYTVPAGLVTQRPVSSGPWASAVQNVTESGHISYPGTISRIVEQRGNDLTVFTHGIGVNRARCVMTEASIPWQILIATANDIEGPKQFNKLSKEMARYWKNNYDPDPPPQPLPMGVTPPPPPGTGNPKAGTPPNF